MIFTGNKIGLGGGCGTGDSEKILGKPDTDIASPSISIVAIRAAVTGAKKRSGGPSQEEGTGEGCDVFVGVVTQAPTDGVGAASVTRVIFNSDGTWRDNGGTVAVVFPRI